MSVIDTLKERGYLKQLSHEEEIKELLEKEKITFYIGFDPTADTSCGSFHRAYGHGPYAACPVIVPSSSWAAVRA